jgi:hypothetical protein
VNAVSREHAIGELWRRGSLRWKLYPDQREVYGRLRTFLDDPGTQYEQFYLDCSRQYGKTYIGGLIADECARTHPNWTIRYVSYTRAGLWQFVQPNLQQLWLDCPADLRPQWRQLDSAYLYPNGSRIFLAGANNGHEDDSRGQRAHLVIVEEAAFIDRLDYLVGSVLLPQTTTTGGRIVFISTPPETPAHEVSTYKERCRLAGNYVKKTIEDNHHLTDYAKTKLITEMGGRESTKARRELWCEWVTDETRAIVPEYDERADLDIAQEPPPPTVEQPIVAMDVGFEDTHAILFGYYNFRLGKRCIQAEVILRRATTDKIAAAIKETEERLWGHLTLPAPVRWSDTDLRLIADLEELHRLSFLPTDKDDKEAQVNALRISIKNRGWLIHPECKALRRQLLTGIWNKQRTEFDRSREDGHFDAVDAAIYLNRDVAFDEAFSWRADA